MKGLKFIAGALCIAMLSTGCGSMNNKTKGGLIGAAGGGALGSGLGAAIGALANGKKGAKIGAAIGAGVVDACSFLLASTATARKVPGL